MLTTAWSHFRCAALDVNLSHMSQVSVCMSVCLSPCFYLSCLSIRLCLNEYKRKKLSMKPYRKVPVIQSLATTLGCGIDRIVFVASLGFSQAQNYEYCIVCIRPAWRISKDGVCGMFIARTPEIVGRLGSLDDHTVALPRRIAQAATRLGQSLCGNAPV